MLSKPTMNSALLLYGLAGLAEQKVILAFYDYFSVRFSSLLAERLSLLKDHGFASTSVLDPEHLSNRPFLSMPRIANNLANLSLTQ